MNLNKEISINEAYRLGLTKRFVFEECPKFYRGAAVYVLEFHDGVKVGMAKNLVNRLKHYTSPWIKATLRCKYYKIVTPLSLEIVVKRRFKEFTKEGSSEFFYGDHYNNVINYIEQLDFYKPNMVNIKKIA